MPYISIDNASQLRDLFCEHGRENTFSWEGYNFLWDYLCEYEDSTGEKFEIDVVGLCCDFNERDYADIASEYRIDLPDEGDYVTLDGNGGAIVESDTYTEAVREAVLDYLNDHTTVCGYDDDTVVFASF